MGRFFVDMVVHEAFRYGIHRTLSARANAAATSIQRAYRLHVWWRTRVEATSRIQRGVRRWYGRRVLAAKRVVQWYRVRKWRYLITTFRRCRFILR